MLYTCPRCHYTFASADKPVICPDCGHRGPAPSTEVEFDRFYSARLDQLREQCSPSMSVDERNWTRILLYLNRPRASYFTTAFLRDHILDATPEIALDTYKSMRWEFVRLVKAEKEALVQDGVTEPEYMMRDRDGHPLVTGWDRFGGALRTLYGFETDDLHAVPGVDAVQAISLERITDNPSEAYTIFIRAWLGLVTESSLRRAEPRDE